MRPSPSEPVKLKTATGRLCSSTTTRRGSSKCLLGNLVRSVRSFRNSGSSLLTLSLCVLTLAGAIYVLLKPDSFESTPYYSLSLSGSGLSPKFTLATRYIYITLTPSSYGSNSTGSWFSTWWQTISTRIFGQRKTFALSGTAVGGSPRERHLIQLDPTKWSVQWELKPSRPPRFGGRRLVVSSLIDRGDEVYILRFRPLQSVPEGYTLEAKISHSGELRREYGDGRQKESLSATRIHVVPHTFTLKGPVYAPFSCPCPSENGNDGWLKALQCPETFTQLTEDLSSFPVVDLHRLREESHKLVGPQSLRTVVHYVVKDNQLYRRTLGPLPGFQHFSDAIFTYLTSVVKLPDVEFLFNLGDWPAEDRQLRAKALPLFGWSGGKRYADIVLPQWDVVKTTLAGFDGEDHEDLLTAQANTARPLEERIPKALFRGRDSNPIRVGVVRLARKYPSLLDAEITSWERDENAGAQKELGGGRSAYLPRNAFADYKYQLLLDGTVATYRTPYLLHSGSVPLKHESDYYEWFYEDLEPMVHYIPFKADLSDLIQQLQWAEAHPKEAAAIAENAQSYARTNLTPEKVVCYYYRALTAYAQRQNTEPRVDADMLRVEHQPGDAGCSCSSHNKQQQQHARRTAEDYPIVPVYPQTVEEILRGTKKGVVLVAYSSFCNSSGLYMPKFLRLARLFTAKGAPLLFAAADGYRYRFPPAYKFCGFPGGQPKVMFLHPPPGKAGTGGANTGSRVPEYMRESLTLYNSVNFVNKHLPEVYHVEVPKDPPDEMSQPLPTDNDEKLVKTVVGANFDDLVLRARKDVLLFVHAPWCGVCKRFKPIYEAFAETVMASPLADTLLFTQMNGTENKLRHERFSWSSYPVLWYVSGATPAQTKVPTQFRGPWTLAGLQNFVRTQAEGPKNI